MITDIRPKITSPRAYTSGAVSTDVQAFVQTDKSYFTLKRVLDVIGSVILLLGLMSWLVPLVAILIKMDSQGPVFFAQKRVGKKGKLFTCLKFRSMVPNREANKKQALPGDQRITRTGRFLRKSNVDELPQLFNVFLGDMSFVGPRPHMPADCRRFALVVPDYEIRSLVKPGITGQAQVKGFHGHSPNDEEIAIRFRWDAFYVQHAAFKLDLKIIIQTAVQRVKFFWVAVTAMF